MRNSIPLNHRGPIPEAPELWKGQAHTKFTWGGVKMEMTPGIQPKKMFTNVHHKCCDLKYVLSGGARVAQLVRARCS